MDTWQALVIDTVANLLRAAAAVLQNDTPSTKGCLLGTTVQGKATALYFVLWFRLFIL